MTEPAAAQGTAEESGLRRHERRQLRDMPLVQPVEGEVLTISAGGMAVRTWSGLAVNKEYFFTFGAPGSRVRMRGRVVWCRMVPSADPHYGDWLPPYRAGIEFVISSP